MINVYDRTEMFLSYYDKSVQHSFGNYRDLLREIAYSPPMGEHLSSVNSKSSAYIYLTEFKRVAGADENFA